MFSMHASFRFSAIAGALSALVVFSSLASAGAGRYDVLKFPPRQKALSVDILHQSQLDWSRVKARSASAIRNTATAKTGAAQRPGLPLVGEINGQWDDVEGYLTYSHTFPPGFGDIQLDVLLRGFDTMRIGETNSYDAGGWDRNLYWLNFDPAESSGEVPHLLPAVEIVADYQPKTGDPIQEFVSDPNVQAECTGAQFCTVNKVPYMALRQAGEDYTGYADGAARATLYFVANEGGDAIAAVVEIYDADGNSKGIDYLYEGDELKLVTIGYRVSEPDFFYIVEYMDARTLTDRFMIERGQYTPGEDFTDPELPAYFDATNRPIQLLMGGATEGTGGDPDTFGYGGPYDLGYTWEQAREHFFGNGFEARSPEPRATPALVYPPKS